MLARNFVQVLLRGHSGWDETEFCQLLCEICWALYTFPNNVLLLHLNRTQDFKSERWKCDFNKTRPVSEARNTFHFISPCFCCSSGVKVSLRCETWITVVMCPCVQQTEVTQGWSTAKHRHACLLWGVWKRSRCCLELCLFGFNVSTHLIRFTSSEICANNVFFHFIGQQKMIVSKSDPLWSF